MKTITNKTYTQSLSHGKCGRLNSVHRVELSDSGAFSEGGNLYYPGHVAYLEARSTNIITHGWNLYREHHNPDNSPINRQVSASRGDP